MIKLYQLAKATHRVLVLVITALTLVMAGTGLILKYPAFAIKHGLNSVLIRFVHNLLSVWMAAVLGLMVVTGLILYCYPIWMRRRAPSAAGNSTPPPTN